MAEKMHVYIRDKEGKIVTHFLIDLNEWTEYEQAAETLGLTMSEYIEKAIMELANGQKDRD